ncbi:hypothetical protein OA958_05440, partial [Bacteroidota bacterium]|nr:hypothetical protein [Bacteroidota bacterium]
VSYTFPPSLEIGGKRWSKFIPHLIDLGYKITLLTKQTKIKSEDKIVFNNLNRVDFFNPNYPTALEKRPVSIIAHLKYKFSLLYMKIITKTNYYDKGVLIKKKFLKKASSLINEENIDLVIITGAPFSFLYYGTILKQKLPIKLISDFRDPWTWGDGYGMNLLSIKRKAKEISFQNKVLKFSDLIFVPVKPMNDYLILNYNEFKRKIKILPHGHDKNDFEKLILPLKKNNSFRIIYGGTTYSNLDKLYLELYNCIKDNINCDFSIEIFTNDFKYLTKSQLVEVNKKLNVKNFIPTKDFMRKIYSANAFLLFSTNNIKDFFSSKFYEIIFLRTPIIFVGNSGMISNFLVKNNLGIHILPEKFSSRFNKILQKGKIENFTYNDSFDVDYYSYKNITERLDKWLIEL